ncbi:hypothetical protein Daura_26925 [Dactylosporangium aurantiacum]|uniref:Uncharacterized protein n=1 Tax=Dactylosporangium aurantiacum TaxID=35754 RepID=A0A9Q9IAK4_9ACTN|nr:hypothetical protein [Dactylosporangium aurantiacum]MDG6106502.1 hypothetical protein [Dactylosporangium aurantiacum]UWZ50467.1 hypothetical protein Daura_26925 [Dactylosporangium aurantiacum]
MIGAAATVLGTSAGEIADSAVAHLGHGLVEPGRLVAVLIGVWVYRQLDEVIERDA